MKTIVWDVDDVLNDLTRAWLEGAWLPAHPDCPVQFASLVENPPHRLLGITKDEYLASLDAFRVSSAARQLQPVAEVLTWFDRYGGCARHVALSAAPLETVHESAAWVMRHFGRWIRTFAFVPSPRRTPLIPRYETTKGEYLAAWGKADVFIDDSQANVEAARTRGIAALLMPQPWNSSHQTVSETLERLTRLVAADGATSQASGVSGG